MNRSKAHNLTTYRAPAERANTSGEMKNFSGFSTGAKSKFITETNSFENLRSPNSSSGRTSPETEVDPEIHRIVYQYPKNISKKLK
jgi:hypothetical protein